MTPAQNAPDRPATTTSRPPHDDDHLLDASRWLVWQSLARGFAHALANASQLLMLDPPPPAILAEARARVTRAHALVTASGRPGRATSFLPELLADFDALQQLQADLPPAALAMDVDDPLPVTAVPEGDVLHVLLLIGTRLKESREGTTLAIRVCVRAGETSVRVTLEPGDPPGTAPGAVRTARAPLLEAAGALLARSGGRLSESDAGWELDLPIATH